MAREYTRAVFESIQGRVVSREPARCVIETSGLGYGVHIPLSTYEVLPAVGKDARLLVHLAVREDEWKMFGFATSSEREVFRALVRVNGVGPVMALSLLSGFPPADLASTVARGDVASLTKVKGIGKKTAERIVIELRDLWKDHGPGQAPAPVAGGEAASDAVRALQALGLDAAEARKRVDAQLRKDADAGVAELVRRSLRK